MTKYKFVILAATLLCSSPKTWAGTFVTLSFIHRSVNDPNTVTLNVASNQVAKLVSAKFYRTADENQLLRIKRIGEGDADIATYNADDLNSSGSTNGVFNSMVVKGPVQISYEAHGIYSGFATFEVINTDEVTSTSSTIVVPADASGPVQVFLESSQDLLSWTEANPGTYGASTQKRFFRVRAKIVSP